MTDELSQNVGWSALLTNGNLTRISTLCLGVWLHAASAMLVATTLPSAVSEFGGAHLVSWAFTLYLLGSILAGSSTGLLMSRLGLKPTLLGTAILYTVGSATCAIAPGMEVLLVGRLLQGLGGGGLVAVTYIAVNRLFPSHLLARLMALISAVWSISAFCGPLIGGSFATFGHWRFAFWAFVIQAGLFLIAAFLKINHEKPSDNNNPIVVPIGRLAILTAAVLMIAFASANTDYLLSPTLCILSIISFWVFLKIDKLNPTSRMFPKNPFNIKTTLGAGMTLVMTASISTMSFLVYGTFLLETLFGVTPLIAGYIVALESVSWGITAVLFSGANKNQERILIRLGSILITVGLIGFSLSMSGDSLWWVLLWAICQGAGFGMMWSFIVRRIISGAPFSEQDIASSSIPTTQQIGFAIGAAASGIVANMFGFDENLTTSVLKNVSFWIFAAFIPVMLYANFAVWKLLKEPTL
ncbi:MAG: MFS transporter [Deltaproteobacteria bacterium]|nr:MFS transporter [Deltaproteobacteria bacterium]MBT6502209.1 MFS transporter [Deltaproteobacteria bacterium]